MIKGWCYAAHAMVLVLGRNSSKPHGLSKKNDVATFYEIGLIQTTLQLHTIYPFTFLQRPSIKISSFLVQYCRSLNIFTYLFVEEFSLYNTLVSYLLYLLLG